MFVLKKKSKSIKIDFLEFKKKEEKKKEMIP